MPDDPLTTTADAAGKLANLVRECLGPWNTRRQGKADREASIERARGEAEALRIVTEAQAQRAELVTRTLARLQHEELRRQANLEAALDGAARSLPESVATAPVEPDWFSAWVDAAKDVSEEAMRSVWARILAGEIAKPGSFSRRTLAFVRTLAPAEAAAFTRFGGLAWWLRQDGGAEAPYYLRPIHGFLPAAPADFVRTGEDERLVDELQLCLGLFETPPKRWTLAAGATGTARYFESTFPLSAPADMPARVEIAALSGIGRELLPIAGPEPRPGVREAGIAVLGRGGFLIRDPAPRP